MPPAPETPQRSEHPWATILRSGAKLLEECHQEYRKRKAAGPESAARYALALRAEAETQQQTTDVRTVEDALRMLPQLSILMLTGSKKESGRLSDDITQTLQHRGWPAGYALWRTAGDEAWRLYAEKHPAEQDSSSTGAIVLSMLGLTEKPSAGLEHLEAEAQTLTALADLADTIEPAAAGKRSWPLSPSRFRTTARPVHKGAGSQPGRG